MAEKQDVPSNGWNEYSKMVLKELETLSRDVSLLRKDIQDTRQDILELKTRHTRVAELHTWKEKMDEVASPVQLKELIVEHKKLQEFKTQSTTIFGILQVIIVSALGFIWSNLK